MVFHFLFSMHLRYLLHLPPLLAGLLAGCAGIPNAPGKATSAPAATVQPVAGLKKGMTAVEVRHRMGPPDEVNPIKTSAGKVEVWVYHREIAGQPSYLQVGTNPITVSTKGADGTEREQVVSNEPIYRTMRINTYLTIKLLMYQDRLLETKQTAIRKQEFD